MTVVRPALITPTPEHVTTIDSVGFNGPENLVYDPQADVFLVSNIGGGGSARDNNGFISRVAPDGEVLELRWIAGGKNGVILDSPKGLAIRGDTLAVADLGCVRLFDRRTGAPIDTIGVPGLVMNDLAFAPDGSLWVTESGPARDQSPVDTTRNLDAVWRVMPGGEVRVVARGLSLDRPDGLVVDSAGALVATFGAQRLERVTIGPPAGATTVATLPAGRVDGLRRLPDGSLVVTSWDARAVWHFTLGALPRPLLTDVASPAGVALDTRRHRLAITSMQNNELYLLPLR